MNYNDRLVLKELVKDARRDLRLLPIVHGFYEDHNIQESVLTSWTGTLMEWVRYGAGLLRKHPIVAVSVTNKEPVWVPPDERGGWGGKLGFYTWQVYKGSLYEEANWPIKSMMHEIPYKIVRYSGPRLEFYTVAEAKKWLGGRLLAWAESCAAKQNG